MQAGLNEPLRLRPIIRSPNAASLENGQVVAYKSRNVPRSDLTMLAGYLALIIIAELLAAVVNPLAGFALQIAILAALLAHATLVRQKSMRNLLLALALTPLIRIVSLGLPLGEVPVVWRYVLTSLPLFAAVAMLIPMLGLSLVDIGLRLPSGRHMPLTVLVAISGLGLGYIEFDILRPEPLVDSRTVGALWLPALILLICTGFLEELIFRGLLQRTSSAVLSTWGGIVYVSLLFGVLHVGHLSALDVVFVSSVALYFAGIVYITKSILGVSLAHGITNVMLFLILP